MAFHPSREFQFQKHGKNIGRRVPRIVGSVRRPPQALGRAFPRPARGWPSALSAGRRCGWRGFGRRVSRNACPRIGRRTVSTSSADSVSVAPSRIRRLPPSRARVERRAGHREHLAALFERIVRGDQRARTLRGFDHDDTARQPGDEAVAPGEVARERRRVERQLGEDRALLAIFS